MSIQSFGYGASTSVWRCQMGGTLDAASFSRELRAAASAQGWRECTPGMLFVRNDSVMSVKIDLNPPSARPPQPAVPTERGQREIAVTIVESKRVAPTC